MSLSPELHRAITQTQLLTDGCDYVFLRFLLTQENAVKNWLFTENTPVFGTLRDNDELSLMMEQAYWETAPSNLQAASVSPIYKRITFDIVLEFDVVGYLAVITKVLASAKIAILALSAFSRDHIFVQKPDFNRAWSILQATIQRSCVDANTQLSSGLVSKL